LQASNLHGQYFKTNNHPINPAAAAMKWIMASGRSALGALERKPQPMLSCDYIERGITFFSDSLRVSDSLRACAVVHSQGGSPILVSNYSGGTLPMQEILAARKRIRYENQAQGHRKCRGCPYLRKDVWKPSDDPIHWVGITHFNHCNLSCHYCWLEQASYSPRKQLSVSRGAYDIVPIIEQLIQDRQLAPNAVIDWGGGGEPTLMPGFGDMMLRFDRYGCTQWLHTNATALPKPVRDRNIDPARTHVLCSVDAGAASTFKAIKGIDLFEHVWDNLGAYADLGCEVAIKYLMTSENTGAEEIEQFVIRAGQLRGAHVIGDVSHYDPNPAPAIIAALAFLADACGRAKVPYHLGAVGDRCVTGESLHQRVAKARALAIFQDLPVSGEG
jgi:pyruvate-formate lyase-activating enzyme